MKNKLLILFLIISVILYIVVCYIYTQSKIDSFIFLLLTSFLVALSSNLYKSNKKKKNKVQFKVDKIKIDKTKTK